MKLYKILSLCMLLILGLIISPNSVVASSRDNSIEYVKTSELTIEDKNILRVEIGFKKNKLTYQLSDRYRLDNQLLFELKNTNLGNVERDILVDSSFVNRIMFIERENNSLDVRIYANHSLTDEGSYSIKHLPADKGKRLPYRLVIDINDPQLDKSGKGLRGKTIVLDPGHGGSDSGAIGYTGVKEKTVALSVAKKTASLLEEAGAKVVMTRYTDKDVYKANASGAGELQARIDVAARTPNADIFVSIHCNAFSNPDANGVETFYHNANRDYRLANFLCEELLLAGGLRNRGTKQANFYVLKHATLPASLVELGFLSNPREEALLKDEGYQDRLAMALVKGISRYFSE